MKKLHASVLIFIVLFASTGFKTPEKAAKKVVKLINSKKADKIEKWYLTIKEFDALNEGLKRQSDEKELVEFKSSFKKNRSIYIKLLTSNIEANNLVDIKLDSITYKYKVSKLGADEKIDWPFSQYYTPSDTLFTGLFMKMYVSTGDKKYFMKLSMVYTAKGFRILILRKKPDIIEISQE